MMDMIDACSRAVHTDSLVHTDVTTLEIQEVVDGVGAVVVPGVVAVREVVGLVPTGFEEVNLEPTEVDPIEAPVEAENEMETGVEADVQVDDTIELVDGKHTETLAV